MSHPSSRLSQTVRVFVNRRTVLLAALLAGGYALYAYPPTESVGHGELGVRINRWTGTTTATGEGAVLMIPGLHELRRYPLHDRLYKPERSAKADGPAPFQSIEGLSLGVELAIRYALDESKTDAISRTLPEQIDSERLEPAVQGVIYKIFARYTVREIFSSKRQELQDVLEAELKPRLAADGIVLRSVLMGNVDLPSDYRAGMDKLLAVELETEKMKYTLDLKEKQVKEAELVGNAEKVTREKAAEAAASEQVIAAKAQEEAMKHVLPFKQKQIEQRQLEAEAEKASRIKIAEASAEARRIEAAGEADSRTRLAEADAFRLERLGKVASEQMQRDGELITRHPLLIQKTLADKLSDKVSVIIAPPPADGGFIGNTLLGTTVAQHSAPANNN
ncbi:regulator of protease activity HflC (stomatin/prohibitin superfamily) [Tahibacter aquaticus]|uniref:Regulator of protease activity HflC (Stomatin/prohibitin superfamily) n=1 Tax=Tahibacter aquaticus TaxID=520092 RepID=A0A4R6Z743_9GAMM|nr:SPFH domain-containing protein [Tahibacter aquaticus]TDR47399.1 regulator of protease activity HflC (stomatin/prohibitin superfamily) [Tahibacter aquaticus]